MDDIYFSRKKNNGEIPPQQPFPGDTPKNETEFSDEYRPDLNKKSPDTDTAAGASDRVFGSAPSESVFSGGYTPYVPKFGENKGRTPGESLSQIKESIPEHDRIPEELRGFSDEDDYFEVHYAEHIGDKQEPGQTDAEAENKPSSLPNEKKKKKEEKKKKMKSGQKAVIAILLIIVICLGGSVAYAFSVLSKLKYNTTGLEPNKYLEADGITLTSDPSVTNILFIGCDDANGAQYSRSDTMMLVSLDKAHKAIKLTSFLRDSYLYIPGRDRKAKINSACSYGGPQFVVDALEYNFEVDIEHYVMVDFKMFINIVNALGGIDVDIEEDEADFLNRNCSNFKGKAVTGKNHLNGLQALDYCRIRYLDNDFYRTQRQRKVISEIIAKAKTASVFNLFGQLDTILKYVETDIPKNELVSLGAGAVTSYLRYDIMQERMPYGEHGGSWYYDTNSAGESIIAVDVYDNTEHIKNFIYNTAPEDVTEEKE
ncbi:MAG: LCP family protein [Clostridia bacterium]|nr:LCP family protein [Clostridia bacterium]